MKIYFGRIPDTKVKFLDDKHLFPIMLMKENYNFEKAVDVLINYITTSEEEYNYYTCNPLILNYFDDAFAKKYVYFIDREGVEISLGSDESVLRKLNFMGPGEALCDDARTFL